MTCKNGGLFWLKNEICLLRRWTKDRDSGEKQVSANARELIIIKLNREARLFLHFFSHFVFPTSTPSPQCNLLIDTIEDFNRNEDSPQEHWNLKEYLVQYTPRNDSLLGSQHQYIKEWARLAQNAVANGLEKTSTVRLEKKWKRWNSLRKTHKPVDKSSE